MRSLSIFFRIIFFGVLAVAGSFLIGRELLLLYTSVSLGNQVNTIKLYSKNSGPYLSACLTEFPDLKTSDGLEGFQLRFIDATHYVVESVCKFHESEPIQIHMGTLPSFATRKVGTSGLFFDPSNAPSKFGVEVLGRETTIAIGSVGEPVEPATSCAGFGYQCCDSVLQMSSGDDVGTKALDCPGRCFAICKSRPIVLSFRTDPQLSQTRVATLPNSGDLAGDVTFTYVVSDPDGKVASTVLDFGDGQSQTLTDTTGATTHTYACPGTATHCSFTAKLTVTDNENNSSPDVAGGKLQIRM